MYGYMGGTVPLGSKRRGIFADPDPSIRYMAIHNPEYRSMFVQFDLNRDGIWSLLELKEFLRWTKRAMEPGTKRLTYFEDFEDSVVAFMAGRFAGGELMRYDQFVDLLVYVQNVQNIFRRVDRDASGAVDFYELANGLRQSGWNLYDVASVERICRAYDQRGTRQLEFDEFLHLRLQWDIYIAAWERHTLPNSDYIHPGDLIKVLGDIKASMEPVLRIGSPLAFASLPLIRAGGFFQPGTCDRLIMRFGGGLPYLTFEKFCLMMEYLRNLRQIFDRVDSLRDGRLNIAELENAFVMNGLILPRDAILRVFQMYDADGSCAIEFDEFVLIMMNEVEERRGSMFSLPILSMPFFSLQRILWFIWFKFCQFYAGPYWGQYSLSYGMTGSFLGIAPLVFFVGCYLLCALWGSRFASIVFAVLAIVWALRWPVSAIVRMIWGGPVVLGLA